MEHKQLPSYKHTQIGYFMLVVTLAVLILFILARISAASEPLSVDSGSNFAVSVLMVLVLFILASFASLTVWIDDQYLRIKFGYGIFAKQFALSEIVSVRKAKNHWYYGWGIHLWLRPKKWLYTVSGFQAVEITLKNGNVYLIGTDVPTELETAIKQAIR